jgi:hypothetical protein
MMDDDRVIATETLDQLTDRAFRFLCGQNAERDLHQILPFAP